MQPYHKIPTLLALLILAMSATMAQGDVVIKKNYLKHNGVRYFKANAQEVSLGTWGPKHSPITQANYVDNMGSFKSVINKVRVTRFKMQQNGSTKANVLGNFSVPGLGWGLSGDDLFQQLNNHQYEFLEISIENKNKFKNDINKKSRWIEDLKQRNDHRIVTSIILVVSGSEAKKLGITHQGSFNGTWDGMKLTVDSDIEHTSAREYQPAPGSVYAYMVDKIEWDANRKKKRTKIVYLKDDQHGPY